MTVLTLGDSCFCYVIFGLDPNIYVYKIIRVKDCRVKPDNDNKLYNNDNKMAENYTVSIRIRSSPFTFGKPILYFSARAGPQELEPTPAIL